MQIDNLSEENMENNNDIERSVENIKNANEHDIENQELLRPGTRSPTQNRSISPAGVSGEPTLRRRKGKSK